MGTRDITHEALSQALADNAPLTDEQRAVLLGAVADDKAWQREADRLRMAKDGAYLERNQCVALIARMAVALGLPVAVTKTAIEGWSEDWHGCIYITLPTGQVSWHYHDSHAHLFDGLPQRAEDWDGHDTSEKYRRVGTAYRLPNAELSGAPTT